MIVLAVGGKFAPRSAAELVEHARAHPGLAYTGGVSGSPMHVLGEQFRHAIGAELVNVPFKGVAQAVTAVIGGQLNVIWMPTSGNLQHFRSGALRALATSAPLRASPMPEVPTMRELGFDDIEAVAWFGMFAPLRTPGPIVMRLNRAINQVLAAPAVRDNLVAAGYSPAGGPPEALHEQIRVDDARYRRLVARLKLAEE